MQIREVVLRLLGFSFFFWAFQDQFDNHTYQFVILYSPDQALECDHQLHHHPRQVTESPGRWTAATAAVEMNDGAS